MTATRANGGLWIVDERRDGRRVITARGRIDRGTAPRLVSAFARDVDDDPVALDLGAVEIAARPGAVMLFHAMRRLHARRRGLIILSAHPAVRRALDNSGLAWRLELVEDRAMAGPWPAPKAATDAGDRADLVRRGMRATTVARRAALLTDATLAIEQRHAEPDLSLPDIAREIGTSRRQLQRVFADLAGSTFRDEIAAIRMHHAAVLLRSTDLRPVDIASSRNDTAPPRWNRATRGEVRPSASCTTPWSRSTDDGLRATIGRRFAHLLIDEFQGLNPADHRLPDGRPSSAHGSRSTAVVARLLRRSRSVSAPATG